MLYTVATGEQRASEAVTPQSLTRACEEIVKALRGTFTSPEGKKLPVQGRHKQACLRVRTQSVGQATRVQRPGHDA